METIQPKKRQSSLFICASFLLMVVLVTVFVVTMARFSTSQNVENRVFRELKSTSTMQASTLEHHLEEQYQPLRVIAKMLENGETFASETMQPILEAMVTTHRWCMLGFADLNGDSISYTGESRSNLSDRAYFYDIINGTATQRCQYLATTKSLNEPRVIFSVPAYYNGEIIGVLYCSKEVNVLEDSLFKHSELFDASAIIFVCDADGKMIVANETAYEQCLGDGDDTTNCQVYEQLPDLKKMQSEGIEQKTVSLHGKASYASLIPLGINDWLVGCIIDEETATSAYSKNITAINTLTKSITAVFIMALGYLALLACVFVRRSRSETRVIKRYYKNYKMLLREMNCVVVEHDPTADTITLVEGSKDSYGIRAWNGDMSAYEEYKKKHPEFDFTELEKEISLAKRNNKTYSFESIITLANGEINWVKVILTPVVNDDGVTKVFIAVLDVSDVHSEFDAAAETFYRIPGGIHRCYLSDPIHLEYFSDGLCKMLGYTHDEVNEIVTPAHRYGLLIHPDDRPIFSAFVGKLAETGGTQTCEYRMICKDGSSLIVSDTMDAKQNSSGIMYGYSIVTDLSKYKELQEKTEAELQKTREQLDLARIKNSNSQMQPHFLYNALASIREIILDDPEYASDLVYDFTVHLRACIKSMSNDNLIPFAQELENIKAYVNIEKMRFGDRLNVEYDCPETDFEIIPLSIQPLVENAIRHGVYERGADGGTVVLRTLRTSDNLLIQVEDNGVGFDFNTTMSEVKAGTRDSTGLFNLIFRFETLMKAKVTVESCVGNGTKITVAVPTGEKP